ncbi:unnamed protein product, partial [marine sediment metagenome]
KQLMEEIQPKVNQRYQLFRKFEKDIIDISDSKFPIIPDEILDENDNDLSIINCSDPRYILKNSKSEFPSYDYKKEGVYKTIKTRSISFEILHFSTRDFSNLETKLSQGGNNHFKTLYNIDEISINKYHIENFKNFEEIYPNIKESFVILLQEKETLELYQKIKNKLIVNDVPNQTIRMTTLDNLGYSVLDHIYLQIYNKLGGLTWGLDFGYQENHAIIGLQVTYRNERTHSIILEFNNQG